MGRRRSRRKPTPAQTRVAFAKAEHFTATCRGEDTHNGRLVDEILDPILWQHSELKEAARQLLETFAESTDGADTPAMTRVRAALEREALVLD